MRSFHSHRDCVGPDARAYAKHEVEWYSWMRQTGLQRCVAAAASDTHSRAYT
jgi:hypothetical protein